MRCFTRPGLLEKGLIQIEINPYPYCIPHIHNYFELVYVIKGNALHILNGSEKVIGAGDYFIVDKGIAHEYRKYDEGDYLMINCLFSPKLIDRALPLDCDFLTLAASPEINFRGYRFNDNPTLTIYHDESGETGRLIDAMLNEYICKKPGYKEIIRCGLTALLISVLRQGDSVNCNTKISETILDIANFVEHNYAERLCLSDICKSINYSTAYISDEFSKQMKLTFTDYVQKVRVKKSCILLQTTDLSANEIACLCGYKDSSFFYRIFKKYMGMTPHRYRMTFAQSE